MRIAAVHIENFRCFQVLSLRVGDQLNVLVGANNSGKSAFLRALDRVLGRAQQFEIDDFFQATPNIDVQALPTIRIDVEVRPAPAAAFTPAFQADFVDDIDFDDAGAPYLRMRTQVAFNAVEGRPIVEHFSVKSDGSVQAFSQRKRFLLRGYIPFYLLDAFRDIVRELRERRGLWGRLLDSIVLQADTVTGVRAALQAINTSILDTTPRLADLRTHFSRLGEVIATSGAPNAVTINPLSMEASEFLRNLEVQLWTVDSPRSFGFSRHGEGTRSLAHLMLFRAFIEILAREENDNVEAEPVLGIEEPEAHLHPHARRAIAKMITSFSQQTFITTHSAAVVRRGAPDNIRLFKRVGQGCVVAQLPSNHPTNLAQPYFGARELVILNRILRSGGAEAFFARAVVLFEGDSEARAFPVFAAAIGIDVDLLKISLVAVDGKAFVPMIRLVNQQAFGLPWVVVADGDQIVTQARYLVQAGIVQQADVDAAAAAGTIRQNVLEPRDWFAAPDGTDFEKVLIDGGATNEYRDAIATYISATALADFIHARNLGAASLADQLCQFMRAREWGRKYKALFAGIVADAITVGGTTPTRIPQIYRAALVRARDFASGAAVKA